MLNVRGIVLKHSMHCFFNSYIRDMNPEFVDEEKSFVIQLQNSTLKLKVKFFSLVGVHQFEEKLIHLQGKTQVEIGFLEAAELLCQNSELYSRLLNSIHNLELSLKHGEVFIDELYSGKLDFLKAEQGLFIGHSFHPTPKSRDEFSDSDLKKYAPEFQGKFKLFWYFLKKEFLHEERSRTFGTTNWQQKLFRGEVPTGYVPYPVHPWQRDVLNRDPVIRKYLAGKILLEAGFSKEDWFATSSMRSLYSPAAPFMVKFSMSVRMTNSLRHLQEKEVGRGMQIQDAFHTTSGKEFSARYPQFRVLHEPAWAAIKTFEGEVLPQTIVLLRENLIRADEEVAVLATLTQAHPLGGKNLIANFLGEYTGEEWFKAFIENALNPLLVAQADHGIMLGAHQQNLLLELEKGLPVGSYFRDCQGTGFSELGKGLMLSEMEEKEKFLSHLVPNEAALSLFTYYLVINSVLNTIAAVAQASKTSEQELTKILRSSLKKLRGEVKDPFVIDYILNSPTLNQKGNFRCSLEGINENTTSNPLSIYNSFANPLYMESSL